MSRTQREPDDPRFTPIMLRRDLLAEGWTDKTIRQMTAQDIWKRARHGAYVDAVAWAACDAQGRHELRARAVLAQARAEVALSHAAGAAIWDLSMYDQAFDAVDVTRLDGRAGRAEAGVRQHRGLVLPGDITERHGVPVVAATRLALELPTVLDLEHSYCYIGELLHRGDTTIEALQERYAGMRRWPHSLSTEVLLRRVHGECESVAEFRTDYLLWRQHLPTPERQYVVRDPADGSVVARLDFAWPDLGAYLEFNGKVKYQSLLKPGETTADAVLREKRREELVRELTGWRGIYLDWADLYRQEHTGMRIRRVLEGASRVA